MKLGLIVLSFFTFGNGRAQFQEIFDFYDNFSVYVVRDFKLNESGEGILITEQGSGGSPIFGTMVYNTSDYGQTWDSTYFLNEWVDWGNSTVTQNGNLYFVSHRSEYPVGQQNYQLILLKKSTDNGLTWTEKVIDSAYNTVGASPSRSFYFMNDSVGVYYYVQGLFMTQDFGDTWTLSPHQNVTPNNTLPIDNKYYYFEYDTIYVDDLTGNDLEKIPYPFFSDGRQFTSTLKNNTVYRILNNWDGQSKGFPFGANYASMQVDPLPFGDQKNIYFPEIWQSRDLAVPGNCIFMLGDGKLHRSCDQGDSFYELNSFPNSPSIGVEYIEFINDTLGFAITREGVNNDWKLYRTTNGGGINGNLELTISSVAGIKELSSEISFQIYPNPTDGKFQIQSKYIIERVEIFNAIGEQIENKILKKNEQIIDLSNCESGIYFVRAFSESGYLDKRIVLTK